jgi:hypothetical protein
MCGLVREKITGTEEHPRAPKKAANGMEAPDEMGTRGTVTSSITSTRRDRSEAAASPATHPRSG